MTTARSLKILRSASTAQAGIKPAYVFDGKPPELKLGELEARRARRDKAIRSPFASGVRGATAARPGL